MKPPENSLFNVNHVPDTDNTGLIDTFTLYRSLLGEVDSLCKTSVKHWSTSNQKQEANSSC